MMQDAAKPQLDASLLDVLPQSGGEAGERSFALPSSFAARAPGCEALAAALAVVESAFTGADRIQVCVASPTPRAGDVEITASISIAELRRRVAGLPAAKPAEDPVWAVAANPDGAENDGALSTWWIARAATGATLHVRHRPPLSGEAVELLARAVLRVLPAVVDGTQTAALSALDVVDPEERQRQLLQWNDTARPRDPRDTVAGIFRMLVAQAPEAIAVVDAQGALDYAALDRRSDALAAQLQAAGVDAGDIVAIAMERSAQAVVAVLAILKAGAAYLPLDASQPPERLAFMLDDAQARLLLHDAAHRDLLPSHPLARIDADAATNADARPAPVALDGDTLAYVMYTSGSTGVPKGVEIRHRSILRLVRDVDYIALGPQTRMLHAAPLGFDASTLEVWGPLLNGGRVVVHDEALPTGRGLARSIARHGAESAWLTAALFNAVVDEDPAHLAGLRTLFTGGEALSVEHVRRMLQASPSLSLHNGYGPTECTTFTCTWRIPRDLPADAASIPIGRPIADTRVYVLNPGREPVPVGVAGELYIAGEGLARGYLRRPELDAERFVPDPFGAPGERLYRSGDRVRYRADGALEFIGRNDQQVKIRGFRIELGEIETALARHPGVRSCALLARADRPGEKQLVAYVVAHGTPPSAPDMRAFLAAALPDFMLPARYILLDALPVTANGKLDRRALPAPDRRRPELANAYAPPANARERTICAAFADILDLDSVGRDDHFFEAGGSSLLATQLATRLARELGREVPTILVLGQPTPASLARALDAETGDSIRDQRFPEDEAPRDPREPIAIVAMAGRFPGAGDVEAFWDNLCAGRDTITRFSPEQLDPSIPASERDDPAYVAARGVIEGVDRFDAAFFGIGPREAELMDPQQRIFLELCWECLERAGHVPDNAGGAVGVFAGMYNATYFQRHVAAHPQLVEALGAFQVMLDNEKDYIATRVANRLDLTGPAISVHTACSTSLVAISQAMDSLRNGRCRMALAGGAAVTCPPASGYRYQDGAMLSPDGRTRSFDADARGTVFSDGAAVVLLKRLSDAIADGNPVYAVLRGSAVNNDGGHKASFTAPSVQGQAAVIAMAQADAGVDAGSIGYVETHGTATPLGDPIEIEGLTRAFRRHSDATGFCRIGSVKSNVGHMVTAAGAAGVIKTALALHHECLPASLHFATPNPALRLDATPFVVNAELHSWPRSGAPRRAGVSSFGVGGTNAHVVLEEAPPRPASDAAEGPQLLRLSARTPAALQAGRERLADFVADPAQAGSNLADVAWTLAVGRKAFAHRHAIVADDAAEAVQRLREQVAENPARANDVVFLFPGQGSPYPGMGRALHARYRVFADALDECAELLRGELGFDLRERMFSEDPEALLATAVQQPAIFAMEYALARQWMALGATPAAMAGHSIGEFVAATLAGVFELGDALRLVARRGALMQARPAGAMLAVRAGFDDIQARLPESLSMAAENAPVACVVAGAHEDVARFQEQLEGEGIACRLLRTSHAFHSAMMDPLVDAFGKETAAVERHAPRIPIVSTATGLPLSDADARSPGYWAAHLRQPVRFATALATLAQSPARCLLEVGPRATLAGLARQHAQARAQAAAVVSSLADNAQDEAQAFLGAVGKVWCAGIDLRTETLDTRSVRQRLCLPAYAFERQRHWLDAIAPTPAIQPAPAPTAGAEPGESTVMNQAASTPAPVASAGHDRRPRLLAEARALFEDVTGFDIPPEQAALKFLDVGMDSLMLTQVALKLQRRWPVQIGFRQLMGECASLEALVARLDAELPADAEAAAAGSIPAIAAPAPTIAVPAADGDYVRAVIAQQMQLMAQQLALLSGGAQVAAMPNPQSGASAPSAQPAPAATEEEAALAHTRYDVKKAFGAIARIHSSDAPELTPLQRERLDAFIARYVARTRKSRDYTQANRAHMADPRVVNGFRPLLKEMTYQIVIERSRGAHLTDLDGNEYVDALNGFGMSLFGWQPEFVLDAVRKQLELGYEIGPQHPLAGEVARRICEVTGHDRAALCNTGSEAVLGALRIARTVTGRETVVVFNGAYHGIIDEMIVRGTKKLRSVPAAPGILGNTVEHVLVLDYGTPESMAIIRERAHEIAAVLVEPVQSRRPDFQPVEFLRELREVTDHAGALLVFDEVVTGFRAHPAGAQGYFGIQADVATYGKVVGGGYPIGVIAGKRRFMDALDGGHWQFGDDSVPTVGVTYFAGTFVRHPLALAAANAVLQHVQEQGGKLQEGLNRRVAQLASELNAYCAEVGAPIEVRHFASVWKTFFLEDHPLQDLLFAMMRSRGVHILDNFPCFFTTAHSEADFQHIARAFKESVAELQACGFLPQSSATARTVMDPSRPAIPGARLGRDPEGRPAWFVPNPDAPGKYLKVG